MKLSLRLLVGYTILTPVAALAQALPVGGSFVAGAELSTGKVSLSAAVNLFSLTTARVQRSTASQADRCPKSPAR